MKLDISRIKMLHGILLPQNEPSSAQNTQRREQAGIYRANFEQKVKEQSSFELKLGVSTGRLTEILNPRIIAPTEPGRGGAANVLAQQNMYTGHLWPTKTPWGDPLYSGMKIAVGDMEKYQGTFAHLGMIPEAYGNMHGQIGQHEQYIYKNNKAPSKLFSNSMKKAEWLATFNFAVDEARTSYAYHVNRQHDEARVYLHIDFVYRDNVSSDHWLQFTFPENEEQKAIWGHVFWGDPLPQFPIIPEAFAMPKSPSLTSGSSSSFSSRGSSESSSSGMQRQSGYLLADELGRLQIKPQNSVRSGASKDPFFM